VRARIDALHASDPGQTAPIPVDLVTSSASGLDPHLSPAAALWQAPRVARLRGLSEAQVQALITAHTEGRTWGFLGEPRVNVLTLNWALDQYVVQNLGARSIHGTKSAQTSTASLKSGG